MRIIQIGSFPTDVNYIKGGVEASVYGIAKELSLRNEVFVMDVPRFGTEDLFERQDGMTVHRFRNPGRHQKDAAKRVKDIVGVIKDYHPSVCHVHGTNPFSWRMMKALKREGLLVALTVHGVVNVEKKNALRRRFSLKALYQYLYQGFVEKRILSHLDSVIVDTEYVKDAVRRLKLRRTPLMEVIPQGIDRSFYELRCSSTSRSILSVGAFSRRKGHLFLIRAFEMVSEQINDVNLTICGSIAEMEYLNEIESYLSGSPHKDRIHLVFDASKETIQEYYRNAHIFALHSQEESQGIVLAEAMAVGLPVVSTRVGGIPYVVEDGVTGLITEYGDVSAFACSIQHLLDNHSDWMKMSALCRNASLKYSWSRIAEQVTDRYRVIH